ncbi:MAG: DNA polymerase III subunit alpha [Hyphomicrobiales bacterium]
MSSAAADQPFIHLRSHSAYSLLEGALQVPKLIALAKADGQPAVAITDTNNLFGALEFSEKAAKAGMQPIIGLQIPILFDEEDESGGGRISGKSGGKGHAAHALPAIVLIAMNEAGFGNLLALASLAYEDVANGGPSLTIDQLSDAHQGLIALTGGAHGPIGEALWQDDKEAAERRLDQLQGVFGDRLYVELQRHGMEQEKATEAGLIELAYARGLPLVATNENFFPGKEDYEAHDALLAIAESRLVSEDDRRRLTPNHAFASQEEMRKRFADCPEAIANTLEIAQRVSFRPKESPPLLPNFTTGDDADGEETEAEALVRMARAGLDARLEASGLAPDTTREDYDKRLEFELSVIESMKFPGYFLIVADFIQWAKQHDIPVGPGRGSGAGSVVAWALTITDLDPLRFGLLFERFLNPERVSMPDFDIDFCQDRRDEVITYVQDRYGHDRVAQIITFGTLQARAVLRDVGRVLEMPYGQVDRLCKMVPANPADPYTLDRALKEVDTLRAAAQEEPIVGKLLDLAQRLEGLFRHASTHAAGVVIGDRPLDKLVPIYREPGTPMPVTQYSMKWVEPAGLVKFDFLGLKTLSIIQETLRLLEGRGVEIDLETIPLDDPAAYELYAKADTVGVFQVESAGMRRTLLSIKPDRFEDIIALVALFRPGPMSNIPRFAAIKHGHEEPDYMHPLLEPVLKETHGIIVYQEQVMEIARVLSGFSLAEADMLRRAMGKKIRSEMDKQKSRFLQGAEERGLDARVVSDIFEKVAKFADYGFNKSHAAAYALVSYQTAYLKANYPVQFLAASMTYDLTNTEKLADFRQDAIKRGITVNPPSINHGLARFSVRDGAIDYALCAIKGVGEGVADHIAEIRQANGTFASLDDVVARINPRIINKRSMENMIAAGVFDSLHGSRARLTHSVDRLMAEAASRHEDRASGQGGLFGDAPADQTDLVVAGNEWPLAERLQNELNALGFFFSAHPLDDYEQVLKRLRIQTYGEFLASVSNASPDDDEMPVASSNGRERKGPMHATRLAGTVSDSYERRTRDGRAMAIIKLTDHSGLYEVAAYEEQIGDVRAHVKVGRSLLLSVAGRMNDGDLRLRITAIDPLEDIAKSSVQRLQVFVREPQTVTSLATYLKPGPRGEVSVIVMDGEAAQEIEIALPGSYAVTPALAGAVRALQGVEHAELV